MDARDREKADAAARAVAEVRSGMLVGLGTGTTAAHVVRALGARVRDEGLRVRTVATSLRTERLAIEEGLDLLDFSALASVDIAIDGADEIDPQRRAIKGGGGALFREKVVAASAARMIAVVDSSKLVEKLGRFPLPIEVVPFATTFVRERVRALGVEPVLRPAFTTDQGNVVFDLPFGAIDDPPALAERLRAIPGVLEHGLFLDEIDEVIAGHEFS
ncbi:MAG: ribose-5-phosphate isomerase RpiA [Labilithrix sp.]|nr:ribose-5-phosphate isomerase RpiA [Labilithrix sp.]MCW5809840.1 ribose-5-phosphate isomerase RpiA [Labilithrix sp.]